MKTRIGVLNVGQLHNFQELRHDLIHVLDRFLFDTQLEFCCFQKCLREIINVVRDVLFPVVKSDQQQIGQSTPEEIGQESAILDRFAIMIERPYAVIVASLQVRALLVEPADRSVGARQPGALCLPEQLERLGMLLTIFEAAHRQHIPRIESRVWTAPFRVLQMQCQRSLVSAFLLGHFGTDQSRIHV